ncbi:hypothetical protein Vafri_501, partial [Volvox africanus]
ALMAGLYLVGFWAQRTRSISDVSHVVRASCFTCIQDQAQTMQQQQQLSRGGKEPPPPSIQNLGSAKPKLRFMQEHVSCGAPATAADGSGGSGILIACDDGPRCCGGNREGVGGDDGKPGLGPSAFKSGENAGSRHIKGDNGSSSSNLNSGNYRTTSPEGPSTPLYVATEESSRSRHHRAATPQMGGTVPMRWVASETIINSNVS